MTTPTSPAPGPKCLGGCGYGLTTQLARARGYGHRCWDKLPRAIQDAITAEIRPTQPPPKPRRRRTTSPAGPVDGQLPITPETTMTDTTPDPLHVDPAIYAVVVVDGPNAEETWTADEWNEYIDLCKDPVNGGSIIFRIVRLVRNEA